MSDDLNDIAGELSEEERAELEALRADKAAAQARYEARREREELERLREERARYEALVNEQESKPRVEEHIAQQTDPQELPPMSNLQRGIIAVAAILIVIAAFYIAKVNGLF